MSIERIGISLDRDLLERFDALIANKGYSNRSEAVRDLIRDALIDDEWRTQSDEGTRVAAVVIVYDHHSGDLGHKLTHLQHDSHDIVISTTHVHMDAVNCLEVLLLKGPGTQVEALGNAIISMNGVKMGRFVRATTGESL